MRAPACLVVIPVLALLSGTSVSIAGDVSWTNAVDGSFLDPARWSGGLPPGAADVAVFGAAGAYTVSVPSDAEVSGLRIDGSAPIFNLSSGRLTLNMPGGTPPSLSMGVTPGELTEAIVSGGTLDAEDVRVAQHPGTLASLRVLGPGAELLTGPLTHIGSEGLGVLDVTGGARVDGGVFFIAAEPGASGFVNVMGSGSRLEASLLRIGRRGVGNVTVSQGGALVGGPVIVGSSGGDGSLTMSGAGTQLDLDDDDLLVGSGAGSVGDAAVDVTFWLGRDLVVGDNGGDGVFTMPGGGAFLTGDLIVGRSGAGDATIAEAASIVCDEIVIATGSSSLGSLRIEGSAEALSGTTIGTGFFSLGELIVESTGELTTPELNVAGSGSLRGAGIVIGTVRSSGVVEPLGAMTIDGDYEQVSTGSPGVLRVELDGSTRRVEATGTAFLDGTLRLLTAPGFSPASGQSFTVLTAGAVTGAFDLVTTPGDAWEVEVTGTSVIATFTGAGSTDLDGDGVVGASDLAQLIGDWGQSGSAADFDGDGVVGASDLAQLIGDWG